MASSLGEDVGLAFALLRAQRGDLGFGDGERRGQRLREARIGCLQDARHAIEVAGHFRRRRVVTQACRDLLLGDRGVVAAERGKHGIGQALHDRRVAAEAMRATVLGRPQLCERAAAAARSPRRRARPRRAIATAPRCAMTRRARAAWWCFAPTTLVCTNGNVRTLAAHALPTEPVCPPVRDRAVHSARACPRPSSTSRERTPQVCE